MDNIENMDSSQAEVQFYWRPGCIFCVALENKLNSKGVEIVKHNIWEDEKAAAIVRSAANGNETVPTVEVAGQFLVNPPAKQILKLLYPDR